MAKCKKNLIQFVDIAIEFCHLLPSKKGRKKNSDKLRARTNGVLFPKDQSKATLLPAPTKSFNPCQQVQPSFYFLQSPCPYVLVPLYNNGAQVLRPDQRMCNAMINQENVNYYCGQYQPINH